jgi:hypothetical protein
MPQNLFIPPTASGRESVPLAGRRLARTLAPPSSAVECRGFNSTENVQAVLLGIRLAMDHPYRCAHKRELQDLKSSSKQDKGAHGFDLKLSCCRKDHHRPHSHPEKKSKLNSSHKRSSTSSMLVVQWIKVGEGDCLENHCKHPEQHDGFPSSKGSHGHVFFVEDEHVPWIRNKHRDEEVSAD